MPVLVMILLIVVVGSAVAGPVLAILGALGRVLAVAGRVAEVLAIVAAPVLVAGLGLVVYASVAIGRDERARTRARLAQRGARPARQLPSRVPAPAVAARRAAALPSPAVAPADVLTGRVVQLRRREVPR